MKTLYFDCKSGISGDMVVGALLDLGISKKYLKDELKKLNLPNFNIEVKKVFKKGIKATKFDVITKEENKHRNLNDIVKIIKESFLSDDVKHMSLNIFKELAKAEAKAHKTTIDKVHFHEVGAIDSIIDIVSTAILIKKIRLQRVLCSRISDGHGKIKISHGKVDLPVPAVRELLKDAPLDIIDINKELVTPTGAAIIKTIVSEFIENFNINKKRTGYGAGTRDLDIPNVLSVYLSDIKENVNTKILLETNIDDMNPEIYPHVIQKLIKLGALDAYIQPCIMKKNRIGIILSVLSDEKKKEDLIEAIFSETSTLGIRINKINRIELERDRKKIKTEYGIVNVKIGRYKGKIMSTKAEYEECKKIADKKKIPLKQVYKDINKYF